jgi:hypothetical protein
VRGDDGRRYRGTFKDGVVEVGVDEVEGFERDHETAQRSILGDAAEGRVPISNEFGCPFDLSEGVADLPSGASRI